MTDIEKLSRDFMARLTPAGLLWHYEHGLLLLSVYRAGEALGLPEFGARVKSLLDTKITDEGEIISYRKDDFNLDQINMGRLLFIFYEQTGERKYRAAIETLRAQLEAQPRTKSGGYWHKKIYPHQMWLDGLFMAEPFHAEYAARFTAGAAQAALVADIARQFTLAAAKTRDPATGLLFHAWDESREQRWADRQTGRSPHIWGRAVGWYCLALLEVLDLLPAAYTEERQALTALAQSLIRPLLAAQDAESGLWYQVLDQGGREGNYLETSCSAMFCCFFFKLLNMNVSLSAALAPAGETELRAAAERAHRGLQSRLYEDGRGLHVSGICSVAGLGGNPYRDGSFAYYLSEPVVDDDFKGVGPFILARIERDKAQNVSA